MEKNNRKPRKRYVRRPSAKDQKKRIRLTFIGIGLIIILAAGILGFQTNRLTQQKEAYTVQMEQLQSDIEDENARQKELEKKKDEVNSRDYIEAQARKQLGLAYEDEVLVKQRK